MSFLKVPNLYAYAALVVLGGLIVTGIFRAGVKYERGNTAAETAEVNAPILEQRGKDEAEVAAGDEASKRSDAVVVGTITQQCLATEETARLLVMVK